MDLHYPWSKCESLNDGLQHQLSRSKTLPHCIVLIGAAVTSHLHPAFLWTYGNGFVVGRHVPYDQQRH